MVDRIATNAGTKLILCVILLVITAVSAALIPALYFFSDILEQEQERAARQGVEGLHNIIDEYKADAVHYSVVFSNHPELVMALENKDGSELLRLLIRMKEDSGVDFITVTDDRGTVAMRTHEPRQGDSLADAADVKAALAGAVEAVVEPGAVVRLAIRAGSPVRNEQGKIVGVVSLGYDAARDEIVDRVKRLFHTEATLFLGDERVSTTIIKDGRRVVGTKLSEPIATAVLREGKTHLGRAEILETEYMTAYLPVMGADNKPVGVLFAGKSLADFLAARNKSIMIVGFIILCFLTGAIFVTTNRLHRELADAKLALEQVVLSRTEELRKSEAQYRAVVEAQTDCIYRCTPEGELVFVNDAFCLFYGIQKETVLGQNLTDLLGPEGMGLLTGQEYLPTPDKAIETSQMRHVRADGSVRWIEYVSQTFFDNAGNIAEYQAVGREITVQKEAESAISKAREAIDRASRVMTLAMIGGGIAHEIKQPLNAIKILVETIFYLQQNAECHSEAEITQSARNISHQVDRIDAIVNNLRSLPRSSESFEYLPCDLNLAVQKALTVVSHQLVSQQIGLQLALAAELPPVYGSLVRFEEVVLNLLVNTIQAFDSTDEADKKIQIQTWADERIHLAVSDNGPGIDPAIRDRIWEPFFTTKKNAESMGLGMSIVQSIVAASHGVLKAENNPNGGVTIQVSFPIVNPETVYAVETEISAP
jgi:PAS domain S-box-containing protein